MKHNRQNNKGIDELFQSKFSNYEFPGQGGNWHLLRHLLAEQKKKNLLWRIRILLASFAAAGILSFFFFYPWADPSYTAHKTKAENRNSEKTPAGSENPVSANNASEKIIFTRPVKTENNVLPVLSAPSAIGGEENNTAGNQINTADVIITADANKEKETKASENYLESFSNAVYINWNNKKVKAKIENMGKAVNSPFPDYAPVINADGSVMCFTSRRPITEKQKEKNILASENIYSVKYDAVRKTWTNAELLPAVVNEPKRFNSIIGLSNDGQRMLLYRDDKYGNGDIYESVLYGTQWSKPSPLPEPVNSKYIETSTGISPDGRTIYFVSNRPGGQGDLDIWYCTKNQQGAWGEAKNLGSAINTHEKEEGVFIHPDGKTLYFSSKGHGGYGGYDIFYSRFENGQWTKPQNLGEGINSPDDDVYFVIEANGKAGYYSSVRKDGLGEKDIYRIEFILPEEENKGPMLTLFKGLVLDKQTNEPLEAYIEIINLEKNEPITTLNSNAASGSFLISLPSGKNYGINVKKEGYLFYSENMNIAKDASYKEIIKTVLLEKLKAGSKVILKNIFYDYDKATLREKSKNELDRLYDLLMRTPNLKVELSAHTDSRGSDAYNTQLSQERAQSCVDYLISKGINKERIIAKGYGKQQPIIPDEKIKEFRNQDDIEAAHQQNRRTEFKILEN